MITGCFVFTSPNVTPELLQISTVFTVDPNDIVLFKSSLLDIFGMSSNSVSIEITNARDHIIRSRSIDIIQKKRLSIICGDVYDQ